ncbi:flagellar protein FlgN [Alteromonadaceae bacterium M269]|nr:flagellar protein FlgN [Alteromonadaceae bacterium M269]
MTEIIDALEAQASLLGRLKQLLENELHLISTRDAETLISLVSDKETLLNDIQTQDGVIQKLYTSNEEYASSPEVKEKISQIETIVSECRYLTEINEKAVEQGQLRLEHLRNLLTESRAKESLTYNKSGKPTGNNKGSSISA